MSRLLIAAVTLACAAGAAACGEVNSGGPNTAPPPTSSTPASSAPPTSGTAHPSGLPSADAARQVYFDPDELRSPRTSTVLKPADIAPFVAWLRAKPQVAAPLVAALEKQRGGDQAVIVISRDVGCDAIGAVELRRQGANFSLASLGVKHREECVRPVRMVAAYAVPMTTLPANPTIDGAAPDTSWR